LLFNLEDVATDWERRPEDENMLARVKAGRARAFFKLSSSASGIDVVKSTASARCRVLVGRSFFVAGPVSSAEESGLVPTDWVKETVDRCGFTGRICCRKDSSACKNDASVVALWKEA
jgi:hypothetical protein